MSELCDCMRDGDVAGARERHFQLAAVDARRVHRVESASGEGRAGDDGKIENVLRLPLVPLDEKHAATVRRRARGRGGSM